MRTQLTNLMNWHTALESGKRMQLYASLLLGLLAIGLTASWLSWTPYSPLISGRAYDEVLDAAAALQPEGIPYRIEDNGNLLVPSAQLGQARAALGAREGLPALGDVGELRLGLTPRAQDWAFLRAREGDIARMINGVEGVSSSRVNVTPRVEALFADEEEPARASVFVKQRPGRKISQSQVSAVVNMVASAVEGLEPQYVSVVNERGQLLSEGAFSSMAASNSPEKLMEVQRAQERRYESAVANALNPLLGYGGGFSVTATVDLELTEEERLEKSVDTEKQALLSEQLQDTKSEKGGENGGIPGVDANLPERPATATGGGGSSETSAVTSNYVYPTVDTKTTRPSGEVRRVSVAVQVDEGKVKALAETAGVPAEEIQGRIDTAVKAAVGFSAERNDMISVTFIPFAEPEWVEGGGPVVPWWEIATTVIPWIVACIAMMMGFLYIVRPLMAAATRETLNDVDEEAWLANGGAGGGVDPHAGLSDRLRDSARNFEPVDPEDLNTLAQQQSAAAAHVLRQWHRTVGD